MGESPDRSDDHEKKDGHAERHMEIRERGGGATPDLRHGPCDDEFGDDEKDDGPMKRLRNRVIVLHKDDIRANRRFWCYCRIGRGSTRKVRR